VIAPDSSVVIPALASWHVGHQIARDALSHAEEVRLVGHVAYESTAALSRMPEGRRIAAAVVVEALARRFTDPWLTLDPEGLRSALERATDTGVRGGALYDSLIAATATRHGARLLTADRRARAAYEAVGAEPLYLSALTSPGSGLRDPRR
jgi:predicted nucleic acid-binding protein